MRTRREILVMLAALGGSMGCSEKVMNFSQFDPQELMARWNAVGDSVVVQGFGTFHWGNFNQFPHPTFKGGSAEAYTRFGEALLAFYEAGDNFPYLTQHNLFTFGLKSGGMTITFESLTQMILQSGLAQLSMETHQKLADFYAEIEAAR
jgi:hypothetical protein